MGGGGAADDLTTQLLGLDESRDDSRGRPGIVGTAVHVVANEVRAMVVGRWAPPQGNGESLVGSAAPTASADVEISDIHDVDAAEGWRRVVSRSAGHEGGNYGALGE